MSKDFHDLPYGIWHDAEGNVYLFNRRYEPIYCRSPEGQLSKSDRDAWIDWTSQTYFYNGCASRLDEKRMRFIRDSFIKGAAVKSATAATLTPTQEEPTDRLEVGAVQ